MVVLLALLAGCSGPETFSPPSGPGNWILSDHYHARKQNHEDYRLDLSTYNYQGLYAFTRMFDHLQDHGYPWSAFRETRLTPQMLQGFSILFINLVSSDRPTFSDDEVDTIIEFVRGGGGLFVIADHSNVYYHAERINRFLEPMGVEVLFNTAVDTPPAHSIAGGAWIKIDDIKPHPVTRGVEMIVFQTGGPMKSDFGVAYTSEQSFADLWDLSGEGFVGNFVFDGDEATEPRGPLQVVVAGEFGKGRVFVVGDQNLFGDAFIHYADNFRLAMNAMAWLCGKEDEQPALADIRPSPAILGVEQPHSRFTGGTEGDDAYFAFYVNVNRLQEVAGRGSIRLTGDEDALLLLSPSVAFSAAEIEQLHQRLRDGGTVMISFEPDELPTATRDLLAALAPDLTLSSAAGQTTLELARPQSDKDWAPTRVAAPLALVAPAVSGADGLRVASWPSRSTEGYLVDVRSDWGTALIHAEGPDGRVDVARVAEVEGGRLVLFMQDGMFRNRSLGAYNHSPSDANRDTHSLQLALMKWLAKP